MELYKHIYVVSDNAEVQKTAHSLKEHGAEIHYVEEDNIYAVPDNAECIFVEEKLVSEVTAQKKVIIGRSKSGTEKLIALGYRYFIFNDKSTVQFLLAATLVTEDSQSDFANKEGREYTAGKITFKKGERQARMGSTDIYLTRAFLSYLERTYTERKEIRPHDKGLRFRLRRKFGNDVLQED